MRIAIFSLLTIFIISCSEIHNFDDIDSPRYFGDYSDQNSDQTPEAFSIMSFNIEFAMHVDEAIEEIRSNENLFNSDVIFLQEMDEIGTEKIAKDLSYNYVYYPASKSEDCKLFGLAILSKWNINSDEKILLPHATPTNNRKRIAMTAELDVGDQLIRVYTIHSSTFIVPKANRREEYEVIVNHIAELDQDQQTEYILVGGDFNTDKQLDIDYLVDLYRDNNLEWISEDIGPTYQTLGGLAKYTLDHMFASGFTLQANGKPEETRASDHLPIWAKLKFVQ